MVVRSPLEKGDDTQRHSFIIHSFTNKRERDEKRFLKKRSIIIMEASGGDDANDEDALGVVSRYALFQTLYYYFACGCIF